VIRESPQAFLGHSAVLRGIEKSTLGAAFVEWMKRLGQGNATNGHYVE
jgi:hypothetical protein